METPWKLNLVAVENTTRDALRRRRAYRNSEAAAARLDPVWRARSATVQNWKYRTHFAAAVSGLLAKVTDAEANPLSLQLGKLPAQRGRYSAASVWKRFFDIAHGQIDMNGLKGSPFVNGIYDQKRLLERGWADNANTAQVDELVGWMEELANYEPQEALRALDSFLYEVPDARTTQSLSTVAIENVNPLAVLSAFAVFANSDTENGRRGQALALACMKLVVGPHAKGPRSVNDPSRRVPGDFYAVELGSWISGEAKQKTVGRSEIESFAESVGLLLPDAPAIYAALVNHESERHMREEWLSVTEHTGTLLTVFDSPQELVRDALVWAGRPLSQSVPELCSIYFECLQHLDVASATLADWREVCADLGISTTKTLDPKE